MTATTTSIPASEIPYRGFSRLDSLGAARPSSPSENGPRWSLGRRLRNLFNPRATDFERLLMKLEGQFKALEVASANYLAANGGSGNRRKDPKHPANADGLITDVHFAGRSATDPSIVRLSTLLLDHDSFGCIVEVWLNDNQISDAGAAALASYLADPSCQLLELWLGRNRIGPAGTRAIARALGGNRTLTCLGLYLNPIGNAGAEELSLTLRKNHTLTTVDIHGCFLEEGRERKPRERKEEEIGITELYGGGCGCKVITPYDGDTYIAQLVASGAIEGADFVTDAKVMHAIQTFVAFNRIDPTRAQAACGITSSKKQVSYNVDYEGEVQSDTSSFLSDLRSRPANERLNDVEKSAWKECEWERLHVKPECTRGAQSTLGKDIDVRNNVNIGEEHPGDVEMKELSAPMGDHKDMPVTPEQRSWKDLKRDIIGSDDGKRVEEADHGGKLFTISDADD